MQPSHHRFIAGVFVLAGSLGLAACAGEARKSDTIQVAAAGQSSAGNEQLADTVQAALHADPYFYDKHVTVSSERGNIVLRGFVASSWDLIRAKQIAAKAAGGSRVIDELSINPIDLPSMGVRR